MISLKEAIDIILSVKQTLSTEKIDFSESTGRILAADIHSDVNMPPFNKSAMDGYACRKEDLAQELEVLEVIPAGQAPTKEIGANQCSKIMTGAQVPKGANTVIMVEHTKEISKTTIHFIKDKTAQNICFLGEDVLENDLVLKKGTLIKPKHIAIMASVGATEPLVYKQPVVGIISTGSELVEPNTKPQAAQIRNSNGHQMAAQTKQLNVPVNYYGIVPDDKQKTRETVETAIEQCDIILLSGGVSVGDFDYVPVILKELGIEIKFNKIAVKPGKHTTFALGKEKFFIGVPGNPVSSFMQFELVVKPFVYHLMGHKYRPVIASLPLKTEFKRKKDEREEFVPVMIHNNNEVEPVSYHGSAHIHALSYSDGMIAIPKGIKQINKGELVDVRQI